MLSSLLHAPPLSASLPRLFSTRAAMAATSARIAVVGDVHDQWNLEEDTKALRFLQPDLVLFTGDFGEENIELVRSVGNLEFSKAVILGNHDAWHTKKFSGNLCRHALSSNWKRNSEYGDFDCQDKRRRSTSARMSWRGTCSLSTFGLYYSKTEHCWRTTFFSWGKPVISDEASVCEIWSPRHGWISKYLSFLSDDHCRTFGSDHH